jgi:hypothetical protein
MKAGTARFNGCDVEKQMDDDEEKSKIGLSHDMAEVLS